MPTSVTSAKEDPAREVIYIYPEKLDPEQLQACRARGLVRFAVATDRVAAIGNMLAKNMKVVLVNGRPVGLGYDIKYSVVLPFNDFYRPATQ